MRYTSLLACVFVVAAGAVACSTVNKEGEKQQAAQTAAAPAVTHSVTVAARRITESQYRHTIADVFGPGIKINARFEPEKREDGLLAVGSTQLSITSGGLEQYYSLASSIADQVLDPKIRDARVGCKPADPAKADAACAKAFISTYGEKLFRRPLTAGELDARVATASAGADKTRDFYRGLKLSLVSLLIAPEYLFRIELAEPDPAAPGQSRLDAYTRASRLSFLLWDTSPDAELLASAKSGAIETDAGLKQQVARLIASPRLEDGARAFFTDMLQLDAFESLNKDPATYPKFSQAVADSAREETLKTIVYQLVDKKMDYRDIFTSNETFINRPLAAVYKVPFNSTAEWASHVFPKESERSGILTQVTFLSLFSHPGRSSPTKRGVKLHEIFMCQPTPDPPPNVDFSKVQAIENGTVRTRLIDHMTNAGCSSCHGLSDPAGLTLEHFDGLGQLRTLENGKEIDVSAKIGTTSFSGAQGLGQMMHDSPDVPACLVRNVYDYGVGRSVDYKQMPYYQAQTKAFAADGYALPKLYERIVTSPEFFKVVLPAGAKAPDVKSAAAQSASTGGK
ncbi:MAG TPA: DUF1592 domain-containing protein [Hyphomonadaceae bacterium]|nr:DUF1592 domain-containing protein [Hyphomonadaceae bacterium]